MSESTPQFGQHDSVPNLQPLHPDARANFDAKAEALTGQFVVRQRPPQNSEPPDQRIEMPHVIINELMFSETFDMTGATGEACWRRSEGNVGLFGPSYVEYVRLAEAIQRTQPFNDSVSLAFVKQSLFQWLTDKFDGSNPGAFCSRLLSEQGQAVRTLEVWVPVNEVLLDGGPLNLGRVVLREMALDRMKDWESKIKVPSNPAGAALGGYWQKLRRDYGGRVAAVFRATAEAGHAEALAAQYAEQAIDMLRLFAPAHSRPDWQSYCVLKGREHLPAWHCIVLDGGSENVQRMERRLLDMPVDQSWHISEASMAIFRKAGLDELHKALQADSPSGFQSDALASLSLYTRAATRRDVSDRLVYVFTALEGLLLKDSNEPIAQNIADRIAFVLERSGDARQRTVSAVKDAYDKRSRFVHHRETVGDAESLRPFLEYVWRFFIEVAQRVNQFKTKQEFIARIEAIKYS